MNIVIWIVGLVVGLLGILAAMAATKPDEMVVSRSLSIQAAPEMVFPLINDFRNWNLWSPWDKIDPNLQRSYTGPEQGSGSKYAWTGNKKVGKGEMTILESTAPSRISIDLHFIAPFEARNLTEFTLNPTDGQTQVVWTMRGPSPFFMKVMNVLMNFEKAIGKDFEAGLAAMKAAAESR